MKQHGNKGTVTGFARKNNWLYIRRKEAKDEKSV